MQLQTNAIIIKKDRDRKEKE